jgi:hypothetical protein
VERAVVNPLDQLRRWPGAMAAEVLALPDTLADLRRLIADLSTLSRKLTETGQRLNEVAGLVEAANLPALADALSALTGELDRTVAVVTGPLDAIRRRRPGAKRDAVDAPSRPAE